MLISEKNLKELERISQRNSDDNLSKQKQTVDEIVADVKANGDKALAQYSSRFDKVDADLSQEKPFHYKIDLENKPKFKSLEPELQEALLHSKKRVEDFHKKEIDNLKLEWSFEGKLKEKLGVKLTAIESAAVYVPGGQVPLISTVFMTVIPAQVAGVKRIVLISPPEINDAILAVAELLEIDEVIALGGAQAIAALAYGTESIDPVYKIVGPGNIFVALAKKAVFGKVGIDGFFGPSELAIVADENAKSNLIAMDLISQLEHGSGLESCLLVSQSQSLLDDVERELKEAVAKLETKSDKQKETIIASFEKWSALLKVDSLEEAAAIMNYYAPEHLELQMDDKSIDILAEKITNAGAIFLGENSCESLGDYLAGPSHCLPTSGSAKFSSGLQASEFLKKTSLIDFRKVEKSSEDFKKVIRDVETVAYAEKLEAHAKAMTMRL